MKVSQSKRERERERERSPVASLIILCRINNPCLISAKTVDQPRLFIACRALILHLVQANKSVSSLRKVVEKFDAKELWQTVTD